MRLFSILTALVVVAALYLLVFERDRLLGFAGREPEAVEATAQTAVAETENTTKAQAVEDDGVRRVSVVGLESTATEIDNAVLLRGRTQAARDVVVRSETSGLIVSDPIRKGTLVEAGQLLCEIDPGTRAASLAEAKARLTEAEARLPEAQARVDEALARLEEAEINDRAASSLVGSGFATETRVAQTKASVSAARAQVESARAGLEGAASSVESAEAGVALAEKEIERLQIKAPFAGLLETDTAELGSLLQPGGTCAEVIQLDPIKLVGFVAETEVSKVELGALAGARLLSGQDVAGSVVFLSRSADLETRTFGVEIDVPNPNLSIRDGQTAEIAIAAAGELAHLIPASALTLDDSGTLGVRLAVKDDQFGTVAAFSKVTLLRDSPEGVFVTGLPEIATVIVVGQEYVTDGVPVSVTLREPEVTQ